MGALKRPHRCKEDDMMREAKPIKMVVSDLDGTLLDESRFISDDAVRLIDHLKKQNIGFTFITGRPYTAVKNLKRGQI